jgi:hypothetical protein
LKHKNKFFYFKPLHIEQLNRNEQNKTDLKIPALRARNCHALTELQKSCPHSMKNPAGSNACSQGRNFFSV